MATVGVSSGVAAKLKKAGYKPPAGVSIVEVSDSSKSSGTNQSQEIVSEKYVQSAKGGHVRVVEYADRTEVIQDGKVIASKGVEKRVEHIKPEWKKADTEPEKKWWQKSPKEITTKETESEKKWWQKPPKEVMTKEPEPRPEPAIRPRINMIQGKKPTESMAVTETGEGVEIRGEIYVPANIKPLTPEELQTTSYIEIRGKYYAASDFEDVLTGTPTTSKIVKSGSGNVRVEYYRSGVKIVVPLYKTPEELPRVLFGKELAAHYEVVMTPEAIEKEREFQEQKAEAKADIDFREKHPLWAKLADTKPSENYDIAFWNKPYEEMGKITEHQRIPKYHIGHLYQKLGVVETGISEEKLKVKAWEKSAEYWNIVPRKAYEYGSKINPQIGTIAAIGSYQLMGKIPVFGKVWIGGSIALEAGTFAAKWEYSGQELYGVRKTYEFGAAIGEQIKTKDSPIGGAILYVAGVAVLKTPMPVWAETGTRVARNPWDILIAPEYRDVPAFIPTHAAKTGVFELRPERKLISEPQRVQRAELEIEDNKMVTRRLTHQTEIWEYSGRNQLIIGRREIGKPFSVKEAFGLKMTPTKYKFDYYQQEEWEVWTYGEKSKELQEWFAIDESGGRTLKTGLTSYVYGDEKIRAVLPKGGYSRGRYVSMQEVAMHHGTITGRLEISRWDVIEPQKLAFKLKETSVPFTFNTVKIKVPTIQKTPAIMGWEHFKTIEMPTVIIDTTTIPVTTLSASKTIGLDVAKTYKELGLDAKYVPGKGVEVKQYISGEKGAKQLYGEAKFIPIENLETKKVTITQTWAVERIKPETAGWWQGDYAFGEKVRYRMFTGTVAELGKGSEIQAFAQNEPVIMAGRISGDKYMKQFKTLLPEFPEPTTEAKEFYFTTSIEQPIESIRNIRIAKGTTVLAPIAREAIVIGEFKEIPFKELNPGQQQILAIQDLLTEERLSNVPNLIRQTTPVSVVDYGRDLGFQEIRKAATTSYLIPAVAYSTKLATVQTAVQTVQMPIQKVSTIQIQNLQQQQVAAVQEVSTAVSTIAIPSAISGYGGGFATSFFAAGFLPDFDIGARLKAKQKLKKRKSKTKYKPSLIGVMSGKTIKKFPRGALTGLEVRYPLRKQLPTPKIASIMEKISLAPKRKRKRVKGRLREARGLQL